MTEAAWNELVDALGEEIADLDALRDHAETGAGLMMAMDIGGIERWAGEQQQILARMVRLAARRSAALAACLPSGALPAPGGGLAARVTLLSIIQLAPVWAARRLRGLRTRLRELRDEIALVTSRNEILVRQALEFTGELGRSLSPGASAPSAYDARGQASVSAAGAGELLELSR
jgi:hypothetical protein